MIQNQSTLILAPVWLEHCAPVGQAPRPLTDGKDTVRENLRQGNPGGHRLRGRPSVGLPGYQPQGADSCVGDPAKADPAHQRGPTGGSAAAGPFAAQGGRGGAFAWPGGGRVSACTEQRHGRRRDCAAPALSYTGWTQDGVATGLNLGQAATLSAHKKTPLAKLAGAC